MTFEIKEPVTKEKVLEAIEVLSNNYSKKTLKKHFGQLKRNIDSMDYQRKARS